MLIAAALVPLASVSAQTSKQATTPPALQQQFDSFITRFRAALTANDSVAVAGMTRLPFQYDDSIRDAAQFRAKVYPRLFTAKNRACIQRSKAEYARDQENNDSYFIFCGDLIFVFTKSAGVFSFTELGLND